VVFYIYSKYTNNRVYYSPNLASLGRTPVVQEFQTATSDFFNALPIDTEPEDTNKYPYSNRFKTCLDLGNYDLDSFASFFIKHMTVKSLRPLVRQYVNHHLLSNQGVSSWVSSTISQALRPLLCDSAIATKQLWDASSKYCDDILEVFIYIANPRILLAPNTYCICSFWIFGWLF
jgi:hypothetical protein